MGHQVINNEPCPAVKAKSSWIPRTLKLYDEGTGTLFGNPQWTEDHSWPTSQQLISGVLPRGTRCMDRYRRRNILEQDLKWLRGTEHRVSYGYPEHRSAPTVGEHAEHRAAAWMGRSS